MNERKPSCLIIASSYPALLIVYMLISSVFSPQSYPYGSNEGGLPANFGIGLIFLAVLGVFYVMGFVLVIASLLRRERLRDWAFVCLAVYLVPLVAIPLLR